MTHWQVSHRTLFTSNRQRGVICSRKGIGAVCRTAMWFGLTVVTVAILYTPQALMTSSKQRALAESGESTREANAALRNNRASLPIGLLDNWSTDKGGRPHFLDPFLGKAPKPQEGETEALDRIRARYESALAEAYLQSAPNFEKAYEIYPEIPRGILEAIAYENSFFRSTGGQTAETTTPLTDDEDVAPIRQYGLMGLIPNGKGIFKNNLSLVSELSGYSVADIKNDPAKHVMAFAKAYVATKQNLGIKGDELADHIPVVLALSQFHESAVNESYESDYYLYSILRFLDYPDYQSLCNFPAYKIDFSGIFGEENLRLLNATNLYVTEQGSLTTREGLTYQRVEPQQGNTDYPGATWVPSVCHTFNRGTPTHIVIHATEGNFAGALRKFRDCKEGVSTHYLISRGQPGDTVGQIVQLVRESDFAIHVRGNPGNRMSIGIEHEMFSDCDGTITGALIAASALLVRDISQRQNIPLTTMYTGLGTANGNPCGCDGINVACPSPAFAIPDCLRIKGHHHYSGQTHHDPGPYWNWEDYYQTVTGTPPVGLICPTTFFTACSGNFTDDNADPTGNGNYANSTRRAFSIAPTGAQIVQVNFNTNFNMANGDWLYVYDGECTDRNRLLGAWSGNHYWIRNNGRLVPAFPYQRPGTITSTGPVVTIETRTDCATSAPGFEASWTSLVNGTPACCPSPTHFRKTASTSHSITLQWDNVGAQRYDIQWKLKRGQPVWPPQNVVSTTGNSATIEGLAAGREYLFRIRSYCGGENFSPFGNAIGATCRAATTVANVPSEDLCAICFSPENLDTSNITVSGAKLVWDSQASAIGYNVRYKKVSDLEWSPEVRVTDHSLVLDNLRSGTDYVFEVQAVCSDSPGVVSDYSDDAFFRTAGCIEPENFRITNLDYRSAKVKWDSVPGVLRYDLRYKPSAASSWMTASTTDNVLPVNGLVPNTEYEIQINTICSNMEGDNSEFGSSLFFTPTCRVPSNVNVSLSSNNAIVSWSATESGVYDLRYRLTTSPSWTTVSNLTVTSYSINGLTGGNYVVQVQSKCSTSDFSDWSEEVPFTIPCLPPTGLRKTSDEEHQMTVMWESSGASSYLVEWKISGRPDSEFDSQVVDGTAYTITKWRNETELRTCTDYFVRVRSVCSSGNSPLDIHDTFRTHCPNDPPTVCGLIRHCKGDPFRILIDQSRSQFGERHFTARWATADKKNPNIFRARYRECVHFSFDPPGVYTCLAFFNTVAPDRKKKKHDCAENKHWDYLLEDFPLDLDGTILLDFQISCDGGNTWSYEEAQTLNDPGAAIANLTANSATVSWQPVAGASSYKVTYGQSDAEEAISFYTQLTSVPLSGLSTNKEYEVEVTSVLPDANARMPMVHFIPAAAGTCGVPSALSASRMAADNSAVSWAMAPGAVSYNLRYAVAGTQNWMDLSTIGNRATLTGLSPATTYKFKVQSACAGNLTSEYSAKATLTTAGGPATGYCASAGSSANFEWINGVTLSDLNNASGPDGGYGEYLNLSANLLTSATYPVTLTPGFDSESYLEYWRVWIDFNANGSFSDPGELVLSPSANNGVVTGSIAVPAGAHLGATRMRIAMRFADYPAECGDIGDGEVEDYTVNITGAPNQTPYPGPHNIPGITQAEDFDNGGEGVAYHDNDVGNGFGTFYRPNVDVDIVPDSAASGGAAVGNARTGEWLEYTLNVTSAGSYSILARVASDGPGGTFHYVIDPDAASPITTATLTAPNTFGWSNYQSAPAANVSLTQGAHIIRVALDQNGTQQYPAIANFDYFNIATATSTNTATFVTTDLTTQGNWKGVYGADGYNVINDAFSYPSYAQVSVTGQSPYVWAASTSDPRALLKAASSTDRIAACWYSPTNFMIDVNLTDGNTHRVAVYILDWDGNNLRSGRIEILDAASNGVLDSRDVNSYSSGKYLVWQMRGHLKIKFSNFAPPGWNAVISGLFFGPPSNGNQTPYNGPHDVPGTTQAEDFDTGGEGIAYHDNDPGNAWNFYRTNVDVDIAPDGGASGGAVVGNAREGEWLEYTVTVATTGNYNLVARVASGGPGGRFHYVIDPDSPSPIVTAQLIAPNSGWGVYVDTPAVPVALSLGSHVVRVSLDQNGTQEYPAIADFDYFNLAASSNETIWVEDALPAGAIPSGDYEAWNWIGSNPSPYAGALSNQSNLVAGEHQHYFYGATNKLTINAGDALIAYVYLDSSNPPSEVMLQWNSDTYGWSHRAYWGANNIPWGTDGTGSRRYMGSLPAAGGWARLEVPASLVDLSGMTLNGLAFTLCDGRATWDHASKTTTSGGAIPAAPSGLTATSISSNQINLQWIDNSNNEIGFKIERSTDGGVTFSLLTTTAANVTSYSNVGLTAGTTYHYRVKATNGSGDSAASNVAAATTSTAPPTVPGNLAATTISSSQINLSWTASTNHTGYILERSLTSGGGFSPIATPAASSTSYADTGLAASTTYYYRIKATNGAQQSAYSNQTFATTSGAPPAAPSNLLANAVSDSLIALGWADNSNNETGFILERSTNGVNFQVIGNPVANQIAWNDSGLAPSTAYYYRLRATNGFGNSAYSNVAQATTFATSPPAAPSNLGATAVSSSQINLSWQDNSSNEINFVLEENDGSGWVELVWLGANVTAYQHAGLPASHTYSYRVRASNAGGFSAYSNIASATTLNGNNIPAAPSNLAATAVSSSQIYLTWQDNSDNEWGFMLERNSGSGFSQIQTFAPNTVTYSDTNLVPATTYSYRVRAYNASGNYSAYSNMAQATTISYFSLAVNGSQWFQVNNSTTINIDSTSLTVEAWIKTDVNYLTCTVCPSQDIVARYNVNGTSGTDGGYELWIAANGRLKFATYKNGTHYGIVSGGSSYGAISVGQWHHVAGVYNSVDGTVSVYVDGVRTGSAVADYAPRTGTSSLMIGKSSDPNNPAWFTGKIDEVRISAEAIYISPTIPDYHSLAHLAPRPGGTTRALWKFDGQNGADTSGNNNTGVLQGGASFSVDVPDFTVANNHGQQEPLTAGVWLRTWPLGWNGSLGFDPGWLRATPEASLLSALGP